MRTRAVLCLFVISAVTTVCGCERVWDATQSSHNLSSELHALEAADLVIVKHGRSQQVRKEITDPVAINNAISLFERYPDDWKSLSGAGGDYDLFVYRAGTQLARLGVTNASTSDRDILNYENIYRRIPKSETETLFRQLNLPWPPRE